MEGHAEKFNKAAARFKESLSSINIRRRTAKILGPEFEERMGKGKRMKVVSTTTPQQPILQQHSTTTPQHPILQQQHTNTTLQQSVIQQQHITHRNTTTITHHNNNTDAPTTSTSFKYPVERGYTVTMTEEQCLEKGKWLNDAIINVTLSWIHHEVLSQEWSSIIRILDSVWYVSATRDYPAGGTDALVKNMERMRKWFPAGHPFDGRVIIIPVCQQNHWFAIVAINVNDGWLVTSPDSLDTQTSRTAQIIVMELVKLCLPQTRLGLINCKVPRQQNFIDCGLHVIRNVANNSDSTWDVWRSS